MTPMCAHHMESVLPSRNVFAFIHILEHIATNHIQSLHQFFVMARVQMTLQFALVTVLALELINANASKAGEVKNVNCRCATESLLLTLQSARATDLAQPQINVFATKDGKESSAKFKKLSHQLCVTEFLQLRQLFAAETEIVQLKTLVCAFRLIMEEIVVKLTLFVLIVVQLVFQLLATASDKTILMFALVTVIASVRINANASKVILEQIVMKQ